MISALISALIGIALIVFVASRYLKLGALSPATNIWINLEDRFEVTRKWWFKGLLVLLALSAISQIGDQLEASKYGIDRDELIKFKQSAKANNMDPGDYALAAKEAKLQSYPSTDEYLRAKQNGFVASADWINAKKLGVDTNQAYQASIKNMKERGISDLNEYILLIKKENQEKQEKEAAIQKQKEEAELRAAAAKNANDPEYLYNKFAVEATMKCKKPIEMLAKNNFEWTDSALERKFDSYITKTPSPGVLILAGDKIKFQNGFGAWTIMEYRCTYDTVSGKVLNVDAGRRG